MKPLVLVILGGGIGSGLRFWLSTRLLQALGPGWPYGTMAVNVLGSTAIGLCYYYWSVREGSSETIHLLFLVGFLGGFTTFSAFSLETLNLMLTNQMARALAYAASSVIFCVAGAGLGYLLARRLI